MKIKIITLLALFIGLNSITQAYTKKDIEYYRDVSAWGSFAADITALIKEIHAKTPDTHIINQAPFYTNAILSAALEKDPSFIAAFGKLIRNTIEQKYMNKKVFDSNYNLKLLDEVELLVTILLIKIIREISVEIINKKIIGSNGEKIRRTLRTIVSSLASSLQAFVASNYTESYGLHLLNSIQEHATYELYGALIAQGITK
jgi:hypothetical protein